MDKDTFRSVMDAAMAVSLNEHGRWKTVTEGIVERHGRGAHIDDVVRWCARGAVEYAVLTGLPPPELAAETVPFYAALFAWGRDGYPHFTLTPDFFHAICETDFGEPTDEPLYMPFHAFTLSFPPTPGMGGASRAFVYKNPTVASTNATDPKVPMLVDWNFYRATLLKPDPIFTQWPIGYTRRMIFDEANRLDLPAQSPGARPLDEGEENQTRRLRTMLMNVLTYIEASGPLPKERRAKKAEPAPVERVSDRQPNFDVGRCVKLDGNIRRALTESGEDRARWKLAQRFIVRGHWRNQAYGPDHGLRRRQWIEPHWRGPENVADALSRTYEVG